MFVDSKESLHNSLKELGKKIKQFIDEEKQSNLLKGYSEPIIRWKINGFKYTEKGVEYDELKGEHTVRMSFTDWNESILKKFQESQEFTNLHSYIVKTYQNDEKITLKDYAKQIIHKSLNDDSFDEKRIEYVERNFVKALNGEPLKSQIKAKLSGVILKSKKINLENDILVRQSEKEDCEIETGLMDSSSEYREMPSAILEIDYFGNSPGELQEILSNSITLLRLFKTGSVKADTYQMSTNRYDSSVGGKIRTLEMLHTNETAIIEEKDIERLKHFWRIMQMPVSKKLSTRYQQTSFYDIAYRRLEEVLIRQIQFEEKISTAIMGLESIFLDQTQELGYRLRLRVAQLLSNFGFDPITVKETVGDAYGIRSQFVHGGTLDYKKLKKLKEKYTDENNLTRRILDYLRISIVVCILMRSSKDEFIDTLDNSFIDEKSREHLHQIVSQAQAVFSLK